MQPLLLCDSHLYQSEAVFERRGESGDISFRLCIDTAVWVVDGIVFDVVIVIVQADAHVARYVIAGAQAAVPAIAGTCVGNGWTTRQTKDMIGVTRYERRCTGDVGM